MDSNRQRRSEARPTFKQEGKVKSKICSALSNRYTKQVFICTVRHILMKRKERLSANGLKITQMSLLWSANDMKGKQLCGESNSFCLLLFSFDALFLSFSTAKTGSTSKSARTALTVDELTPEITGATPRRPVDIKAGRRLNLPRNQELGARNSLILWSEILSDLILFH